ncbi:MAG TPA: hypothetical protein VMP08_26705 [Anaerolineae bacterium]|nr:hypothetical protein [Anaerolineae bacterium]
MELVRPLAVGVSVVLALLLVNNTVPNIMNATELWQYLAKFLLYFSVALVFYGAYYFLIERPIVSRKSVSNKHQGKQEQS